MNKAFEIHDWFYEQLGEKLNEAENEFSFKHFSIKSEIDQSVQMFSIKESNSFIRDGTTGLKLWPAAIKLGDFVAQNPHIFDGRSVLELGSGASGLVGMALLTFCRPKKVFLSDCHDLVIENLIDNVSLNLKELEYEEKCKSLLVYHGIRLTTKDVDFAILKLPWESIDENKQELENLIKPDLLLASDIIYDEEIFDALFECLAKMFAISSPRLTFYLSQTVRNQTTYQKFLQLLLSNGYEFHDQDASAADTESEIKIIKISKTQAATCTKRMDPKLVHDFPL